MVGWHETLKVPDKVSRMAKSAHHRGFSIIDSHFRVRFVALGTYVSYKSGLNESKILKIMFV
jgi:hypothetical protein